MSRAVVSGHCMTTAARTARRVYYCGGCASGNAIQPGDRHLEHTEFPGGESGFADSAGHPVRMRECARCAHRCGRGELLDETGRETVAFSVLEVVHAWAYGHWAQLRVSREGGESTAEAVERMVRECANEAESVLRYGRPVSAALAEISLLDDYLRIKAGQQADAFEVAS